MSDQAVRAYEMSGIRRGTTSYELNFKELMSMDNSSSEFMIYGYVPMMISAQCVYKNYDKCRKADTSDNKKLHLNDRKNNNLLINRNCSECYNVIYNAKPNFVIHKADDIKRLNAGGYRISFTNENINDISHILKAYENAFIKGNKVDPPKDFTNGHLSRGVL